MRPKKPKRRIIFHGRTERKAFVAYASRDQTHAEALLEGVRRANALPQPYDYRPWQFNDIAGQPLISPILENLQTAEVAERMVGGGGHATQRLRSSPTTPSKLSM
jgi:hypothetical protein